MNLKDIIKLRLIKQQVNQPKLSNPRDVVNWMGAMQAQDFAMARWAVGLRTSGSTESIIVKSINEAEIIRTHLLRPTWHFVSSEDIYWMLELSAPQIRRILKSRHKQLELTEKLEEKSSKIIENTLAETGNLTGMEIAALLNKNKIRTDENRIAHLLMSAELKGIICSGRIKNNRHTYSLLSERVKPVKSISREEALAKLAHKYFQSHSPASINDFIWWSGLSVKDAKTGVESIRSELLVVRISSVEYYINDKTLPKIKYSEVHMLPAYDEMIIAYKDRSLLLTSDDHKKVISINGLFRPSVLINGIIAGVWKRSMIKDKMYSEVILFRPAAKKTKDLIYSAVKNYGKFYNKEINTTIV